MRFLITQHWIPSNASRDHSASGCAVHPSLPHLEQKWPTTQTSHYIPPVVAVEMEMENYIKISSKDDGTT